MADSPTRPINYPDLIESMAEGHWKRDVRGTAALLDWRELARQLRAADAVDPIVASPGKLTTRDEAIPEFLNRE